LLSLNTGWSEGITDGEPAQVEVIDDDQVYHTEAVAEPQAGPELDEALSGVTNAVEAVTEPPDDEWGFTTTVKSVKKEKKKLKKNPN
jgi:hypothetical protein